MTYWILVFITVTQTLQYNVPFADFHSCAKTGYKIVMENEIKNTVLYCGTPDMISKEKGINVLKYFEQEGEEWRAINSPENKAAMKKYLDDHRKYKLFNGNPE